MIHDENLMSNWFLGLPIGLPKNQHLQLIEELEWLVS